MLTKIKKPFITVVALGTLMTIGLGFANCDFQNTYIFNQVLKSDGHLQKEEIRDLRELVVYINEEPQNMDVGAVNKAKIWIRYLYNHCVS